MYVFIIIPFTNSSLSRRLSNGLLSRRPFPFALESSMEQVINRLWFGDDNDYEKIEDNKGWKTCRCCKYGPGGHQATLQYKSLGAPKGDNYLSVERPNRIALNYIDANDSHLIPPEMIVAGLRYVDKMLAAEIGRA